MEIQDQKSSVSSIGLSRSIDLMLLFMIAAGIVLIGFGTPLAGGALLVVAIVFWMGFALKTIRRLLAELAAREEEQSSTRQLLRRFSETAETADRAKQEFLKTLSRQIRAPINAIVGFTTQVADRPASPVGPVDPLLGIQRNCRHLLSLVDELLDPLKLDQKEYAPAIVSISPWRVVEDVIHRVHSTAQQMRVDVSAYPVDRIPRRIDVDPVLLRQVLSRLMLRAIQGTTSGRVILRISLISPDTDVNLLRFVLSETDVEPDFSSLDVVSGPSLAPKGPDPEIGMANDEICRLLSAQIYSRSGPASALPAVLDVSLPPCRPEDLIEAGQLFIESLDSDWIRSIRFRGQVLLCEDSADNQEIIAYYLRSAGLSVDVAANGRVALERFVQCHYDLVIMDMQMPVLDGYVASRELRARGYTVPIIALTANAMPGDRQRCINAGCTDYLAKPVERAEMFGLLSRFLPSPLLVAGHSQSPSTRMLQPQHQWIDDSLDNVNDQERYRKLLLDYVQQLPHAIAEIQVVLRAQNYSRAEMLAHRMKGSAGMFGLSELSESAGLLESALAEDRDLELLEELSEELMQISRGALKDVAPFPPNL